MGIKKNRRLAARVAFKFKPKTITPTKPAYTTIAELEAWIAREKRSLASRNRYYGPKAIKKPKAPTKKNKAYWEAQYLLPQWLKRRAEILALDEYKCTKCQSVNTLQVHHLCYYYTKDVWDYSDDDLVTLCQLCHEQAHKDKPIEEFYKKNNTNS